ncbi:uncharacterized protein LAJ45_02555 [Morchella importuna]|uniref:uncharacterized protein n=1 Tax=Morchella importuna TaxID=1174673 RepID=UPI001E8CFD50|nr:uncharacterized protein LAJ45_02555 [Morchella importuna]KAH8153742.1 hypothetical protein LAJ45_02555 [Morchella importuna]
MSDLDGQEDSLLGGPRKQRCKWQGWMQIGLGVWAAVATVGIVVIAVMWVHADTAPGSGLDKFPPSGKKNIVFMVSDGMGPTSLALTREYRQLTDGLSWDNTLTLDKHLIGTSRTRSTNSLVTDSAAGATAFSCGIKSYNGAISVLPDGSPCGTVLEAAKKAGYMTGLVVTTRLTDATPACFSAHVNMRMEEDRIAEQQLGDYPLGRVVDLMMGGGACHFLPNSTEGSCRKDDRDLVTEAQEKFGFQYVSGRKGFDSLEKGKKVKLPLLGLFASTDIPFEIDRKDEEYPSLDEMTEVALRVMEEATKHSDKGFFLMVEGSRIDHAGHGNDPAAQVREVLGYDKAFNRVLKFVENAKNPSVLVATSDHETGGLALARQLHASYPEYLWYPEVLANASSSSEYLAAKYAGYSGSSSSEDEFVKKIILEEGLGVHDASEDEIEALKAAKSGAAWVLADIISRRAQVGWSTHGHSGVDVNIYGSKGSERLHGNHENTDVGNFIKDFLEIDVDAVTEELKEKGVDRAVTMEEVEEGGMLVSQVREYPWMGRSLHELAKDGFETAGVDCYHGDYKHKH